MVATVTTTVAAKKMDGAMLIGHIADVIAMPSRHGAPEATMAGQTPRVWPERAKP